MSTTDGPTLIPDSAAEQAMADREAKGRRRQGWFPGLGDKWNALPRHVQWLWLMVVVVIAYLLPILNPPLITTEPGNNWQIALAQMAVYALVAVGLNVVVGYAGLLDLGYVAFFRRGFLHGGHVHQSGLAVPAHPLPVDPAARDGDHDVLRGDAGCAHPASPR